MEARNFYAVSAHLNQFYGITIPNDDFENLALHAWDHVGNKNYRSYVYDTKIEDYEIHLPCNADIVEAVMRCGEDFQHTDGVDTWTSALYNQNVETWVELWKQPTEFLYEGGTYISYEQEGNILRFKVDDQTCKVLYKGILADEAGLPMLNFKEIDAIAKYCAWIHLQKKGMITRDQATMQMAQMMHQQWQSAVDDARTPIYLNQNDMDKILNVQSSWDRKRYNRSYKPVR
jgi:hypothetical protein